MYEEQLAELGLTENEVKIYLALLIGGVMNPSDISKKLGLHRGYVYDALERMQEKGVVSSILQDNKRQFQATSPENLVELLKLRLESFMEIVPKLSALVATQKEDTNVSLHKGKGAYRVLLKDIIATLKKNDEVLLVGVDEQVLLEEVEPIYLEQYFSTIKKKNIREKVIMKEGKKDLSIPNVKHKFLDEKYIGNTEQIIYGEKVAIFILGTPYYLIIIDNREVADTYRKQFELLWKIAK
tara:strand:- start:3922 stop:4641 length:720 start_codon:yes stop_codon:yes gene_type:complete